jgi:hypothetical protein
MSNSDELRRCVQDLLGVIVEQLELARSPSDQFAGVDAAHGAVRDLRSKLEQDSEMLARVIFAIPLSQYLYSPFADEHWKELASESPPNFAKSADELVASVRMVKAAIDGMNAV